jgi:integrase
MAGKLNARKVESLTSPGRHSDGQHNLYLSISSNGGKRWTFLYRWKGKRKEMGLGSAAHVSLAEARAFAMEARKNLNAGIDPLEVKAEQRRASIAIPPFGAFADEYIQNQRAKFRNNKHVAQWEMTLSDAYCKAIRSKPLNELDTEAILKVLQPIWQKVPETASRIRGRIENVIDAAKVRGFYDGENPARWKGHLKAILPARQKLTRGHHAALPYDDIPSFIAGLRGRQSTAALALEFTILCATRSGETLGATWDEIDLTKGVWTISKHRMKAGHEHRVPLSGRALTLLNQLNAVRPPHNPHVFPGNERDKPLSGMAMTMQLRRMERDTITVHGFRSSFRDWASEQTSFPHETCEHALAHRISDKAEAAYRRGDQFEKRRLLMEAWANFCDAEVTGNVVQLRQGTA